MFASVFLHAGKFSCIFCFCKPSTIYSLSPLNVVLRCCFVSPSFVYPKLPPLFMHAHPFSTVQLIPENALHSVLLTFAKWFSFLRSTFARRSVFLLHSITNKAQYRMFVLWHVCLIFFTTQNTSNCCRNCRLNDNTQKDSLSTTLLHTHAGELHKVADKCNLASY